MKKPGLAGQFKNDNWVTNPFHPDQSPDLNPCEACWNILKQRVRRRTWQTEEQLKEIIQEVWRKITMEEIRKRIADMPRRCDLLVKTGGKAIKSRLW